MNLDQLARGASAEVRDQMAAIEPPTPGAIVRRSRRRRATTGLAVLAVLALAGVGLAVAVRDGQPESTKLEVVDDPQPRTHPGVPVWYDARGLHHGDVVEQTPVEIMQQVGEDSIFGALALVRSGAVYLDPATNDVWFHPWGGAPRIVGHDSTSGPGGDPNGDTAAWFEGSAPLGEPIVAELVVYDTAAGREISRTEQPVVAPSSGDHYPAGNDFLQVSAEAVVWSSMVGGPYRYDLSTQTMSVLEPSLMDVHDQVEISIDAGAAGDSSALVLTVPGRADERYPSLESHVRLSLSGNYVLGIESTEARHAAAIVDTRTGELWQVPRNAYPWIAWSYGDIALVDTERALLACDAARRDCERLRADRPFLMPTN